MESSREVLLVVEGLYKVHFLAASLYKNLLTGAIIQDSLVHCPEWVVLILANLILRTLVPNFLKA